MATATTRTLTLCADDFGLAPGIDRAILRLGETRRISAVSCMTGGASWRQSAPELARLADRLDLGLHLTLTELPPLGPMPRLAASGILPPINALIGQALLCRLNLTEIRNEARRQIETFCQYLGRPPTHIDGHQHVHCFPVVRTIVYELAEEYGCYVRNCATDLTALRHGAASPIKSLIINCMGLGFNGGLAAKNIPHNQKFFGLHDFNPTHDLHAMVALWLHLASDGTLINCHPGIDTTPGDPLANWRRHEYDYLCGDSFAALLRDTGTVIAPFRPPVTPAG